MVAVNIFVERCRETDESHYLSVAVCAPLLWLSFGNFYGACETAVVCVCFCLCNDRICMRLWILCGRSNGCLLLPLWCMLDIFVVQLATEPTERRRGAIGCSWVQ